MFLILISCVVVCVCMCVLVLYMCVSMVYDVYHGVVLTQRNSPGQGKYPFHICINVISPLCVCRRYYYYSSVLFD